MFHTTVKSRILKFFFKRIELFPGEEGHNKSDKDYFKLSLGELTKLPKAILSKKWRSIVFIPTTLERLYQADEINDLYDTSPLEDII